MKMIVQTPPPHPHTTITQRQIRLTFISTHHCQATLRLSEIGDILKVWRDIVGGLNSVLFAYFTESSARE